MLDNKNINSVAVVILYEMSQELIYEGNISFGVIGQMLNVGRILSL